MMNTYASRTHGTDSTQAINQLERTVLELRDEVERLRLEMRQRPQGTNDSYKPTSVQALQSYPTTSAASLMSRAYAPPFDAMSSMYAAKPLPAGYSNVGYKGNGIQEFGMEGYKGH